MAWTTATDRVLQWDVEVWSRAAGPEKICHRTDHEMYVVFEIWARDVDGARAVLDVSGAASVTCVAIDPSGSINRWTMADRTDGTDGLEQYQITATDLTEPGAWTLYAEIAFGTGVVSTNRVTLHVQDDTYQAPLKKNEFDETVATREWLFLEDVTVDSTLADSDEIPYENFALGSVLVPSGSSLTTLTWHQAEQETGTFLAAYDDAGTPAAVTQTVAASRAYPIPTALAGAHRLKITGNADGVVDVVLKS